jgi:hypothetical protein
MMASFRTAVPAADAASQINVEMDASNCVIDRMTPAGKRTMMRAGRAGRLALAQCATPAQPAWVQKISTKSHQTSRS